MESYYVVKKGFKTGIFKTWAECKSAVNGFSGPIFKKFESFQEASDFFKQPLKEPKYTNQEPFLANKNVNKNPANSSLLSETDKSNMENIKAMTINGILLMMKYIYLQMGLVANHKTFLIVVLEFI